MEIDIITYTPEQYAVLSSEQLQEVRLAQQRKNRLTRKLEEDKQKEKSKLIANGIWLSGLWDEIEDKLDAAYQEEIDFLRNSLLFYLHYSAKPEFVVPESHPYKVDYSLSEVERFQIVRQYYMEAYTDDYARFEAFKKDTVAVPYLGELYKSMYDYFLELAGT